MGGGILWGKNLFNPFFQIFSLLISSKSHSNIDLGISSHILSVSVKAQVLMSEIYQKGSHY